MTGKSILKSNFIILFDELNKAVENYLKYGHLHGEMQYVNAFLAATIHSLIDYADRYLDKKNESIQACRYANNSLKHIESLVTHSRVIGGFHFPFSCEEPIVFPQIQVIWNYSKDVKTRHPDQQRAFETLFAGKPIIETLLPLAQEIENN